MGTPKRIPDPEVVPLVTRRSIVALVSTLLVLTASPSVGAAASWTRPHVERELLAAVRRQGLTYDLFFLDSLETEATMEASGQARLDFE